MSKVFVCVGECVSLPFVVLCCVSESWLTSQPLSDVTPLPASTKQQSHSHISLSSSFELFPETLTNIQTSFLYCFCSHGWQWGEESEGFSGEERSAQRVFGHKGGSRRRPTTVCGASHLLQSPTLHAASQGSRGRIRLRSKGNHNHPLSRRALQERSRHHRHRKLSPSPQSRSLLRLLTPSLAGIPMVSPCKFSAFLLLSVMTVWW